MAWGWETILVKEERGGGGICIGKTQPGQQRTWEVVLWALSTCKQRAPHCLLLAFWSCFPQAARNPAWKLGEFWSYKAPCFGHRVWMHCPSCGLPSSPHCSVTERSFWENHDLRKQHGWLNRFCWIRTKKKSQTTLYANSLKYFSK